MNRNRTPATQRMRGAWSAPTLLLTLCLFVFAGCGLVEALAGADPPDPAAVAALKDAQTKYEATLAELAAVKAQMDAGGVTPEVIERLAAQVAAVNDANRDVQQAVMALREQEDAGGSPWWIGLLQILGAQLGLDWVWRGGPSKGAGGALLRSLAGAGTPSRARPPNG